MAVKQMGNWAVRGSLALALAAATISSTAVAAQEDRGGWRGSRGDSGEVRGDSGGRGAGWRQSAPQTENRGGGAPQRDFGNRGSWNNPPAAAPAPAPAPQAAPQPNPSWQGRGGWQGQGGWQGRGNAQGGGNWNGGSAAPAPAPRPAIPTPPVQRDNPSWRGGNDGGANQWRGNNGGNGDRARDNNQARRNEYNWHDRDNRRDERRDNRWNDNRQRYDHDRDDSGRGWGYQQDHRRWDNHWRDNRRYDWYSYRSYNPSIFRLRPYYAPYRNYSYRRLSIGFYLDSLFFGADYWINDPGYYRLPPVYGPYRWVRYYDDALLVDIYSGQVVDVIYSFFW